MKHKERIQQLENELAQLKKELNNESTLKTGDWFAVDECGHDKNETWISRIGEHYNYKTGNSWGFNDEFLVKKGRKATPEEIERALITEAKRRYDVPCELKYLDNRVGQLNGFHLVYHKEKDALCASVNTDVVYMKGEWAEKRRTFFGWDTETNEFETRIGCKIFDNTFIEDFKTAITFLDNDVTIQQLKHELQNLKPCNKS